jgi:hypothetical protein
MSGKGKTQIKSQKLPNQMDEWQEGRPGGTYNSKPKSSQSKSQLEYQQRMNEINNQYRKSMDAIGEEYRNNVNRAKVNNSPQRKSQISSQKIEPKRTKVKTSVSMSERKMGPSDDQIAASRREGQKRAEEENRKRRQYENAFGGKRR